MEQTISGESDVQTIFETLLTTSSPPNQPSDFLKPPALLGVTFPGRGRLAPSGGWPRAGRASKGPPKEGVPGFPPVPPWPDPALAGAGGGSKGGVSGGERYGPRPRFLSGRGGGQDV